ncbi:iron chaperone [Streptomyces sp. NRRL F-2664]|uniref:iron chaperone n=1 Tax=Streptomyces sp. NRRL F-2664 TaxID=1463842 RepID=UPI0004CC745B|nr:DUF1801 domain-containing protein [Streptomyces sp. NRRL F-2664]
MDVTAYLAAAPDTRRPALARLRELCRAELPGYEEGIAYGMPVYVRRGGTDAEIAWANQKQYISFYLMRPDVREAFADRLAAHDMGRSCLRFRNPAKVDFDLVRDLLRATAEAEAGGPQHGG